MKRMNILQQQLLNIIAPMLLFVLVFLGYNYYSGKQKLSESKQEQINHLTLEIKNLVDLYDQGMVLHEASFNKRMEQMSKLIVEEEVKGIDLSTVDLYKLSVKLGLDKVTESIYIIDTNAVICNTTFRNDLGLNFRKIAPDFAKFFDKIREEGKFSADRFGLEMSTKKIKKYSFIPSTTKRFVIELGFYSSKADDLQAMMLKKVQVSAASYSSLRGAKIDAVIKNIPSLVFEKRFDSIINKVIQEKKDQVLTEEKDGLKVSNHFVCIEIANTGLYDSYILQVVTDNQQERELLKSEFIKFIKILVFFIFPLSLFIVFRARVLIKPIKNLSEKTKRIRQGNLSERIEISGATEIAELSSNFNHMVEELQESYRGLEDKVKERTKEIEHQKEIIEEKQKEIVDSINYAKRIQYSLLAHKDFLEEELQEHFVFFHPKDIVSGDFYWAASTGSATNRKFYIAACDSTGHGVPGAFMSLLNIGYLNEAIKEKGIEKPNEVLNFVRQRLIDNISKEGQKDGFDGILLCIDQQTKKLSYAAANNAPLIVRKDGYEELEADRMPVGMGERKEDFKLHKINYEKGDVLYLYTDGYADQFGGPKGKKYKYRPLNEMLQKISPDKMEVQRLTLANEFENWRGELEQVDDVLIIGIRL
jgi:sigma-B regulation protein RsbU (phosphoserine phosphatase)